MAAAAAATATMTAEELLQLPAGMGQRYELVAGVLQTMSPTGYEHGGIVVALTIKLGQFVRARGLGRVLGAETGFILSRSPDTVRAPDVSFVSQARDARAGRVTGFFPGAPDLAVEVVSPSDTAGELQRKVGEYFEAGSQQVWIVYPELQQVTVFRSASDSHVYAAADSLTGGDLLPGFTCPVAELFD